MFCSCSFAPIAAGISTEFCPHVSSSGVTLVMSKTILPPASLLSASSVLSPSLSMGSPALLLSASSVLSPSLSMGSPALL